MYKESVLSELCSVSSAERRAFEELHPPLVQAIPKDEVLSVAAKARRSTDRHLRLHIEDPDVLRRAAVGVDSDVSRLGEGKRCPPGYRCYDPPGLSEGTCENLFFVDM